MTHSADGIADAVAVDVVVDVAVDAAVNVAVDVAVDVKVDVAVDVAVDASGDVDVSVVICNVVGGPKGQLSLHIPHFLYFPLASTEVAHHQYLFSHDTHQSTSSFESESNRLDLNRTQI